MFHLQSTLPRISRNLYLLKSAKFLSNDVSLIKKLREMSGAPMMDCKNALAAADVGGDIEKALAWLRAKGISKVSQANRATKEGLIGVASSASGNVALVEVNCETDFVSINEGFQKFVSLVATSLHHHYPNNQNPTIPVVEILAMKPAYHPSMEGAKFATIEQALGDVVASIRENIVIKRAGVFQGGNQSVIASYVHNKVATSSAKSNNNNIQIQLGRAAALVKLSSSSSSSTSEELVETGRRLAMHIVAAKPLYLVSHFVPATFLDQEKAIFQEQENNNKKPKKAVPPVMQEKILQNKLQKRLMEVCLLGQSHLVEEGNPIVQKFMEGKAMTVEDFALWTLNQE